MLCEIFFFTFRYYTKNVVKNTKNKNKIVAIATSKMADIKKHTLPS